MQTWAWVRAERCIDRKNSEFAAAMRLKRAMYQDKSKRSREIAAAGYAWAMRYRDLGGPFRKDTAYVEGGRRCDVAVKVPAEYYLRGDVIPYAYTSIPTFLAPTSEDVLFARGGQAIRAVAPTNPHASLTTALIETWRDGLPSVPGVSALREYNRRGLSKTAGHEYLNTEFGWKPFLSDVSDFLKASEQSAAIWAQAVRDSDRAIHRSMKFDPTESTLVEDKGTGYYPWPVGVSYLHSTSGRLLKTTKSFTQYWFDGLFRYHIPAPTTVPKRIERALREARLVYGLDLSPETLWSVMPWSWLVDWVIDFHGLMRAITMYSTDGLVLQYGYLMEHRTVITEYTLVGHRFKTVGQSGDGTLRIVQESKRRVAATPFGFGLNIKSFSPRQLAILAAVGITLR